MTHCPECGEQSHFAVKRLTWVLRPGGSTKNSETFRFGKRNETLPDLNEERLVTTRCLNCGHEF